MTNGDRLRALDDQGLAGEVWKLATCEYVKHINLPEWLASEEAEYPIEGKSGVVTLDNGERYACKVVGTKTVFGQVYYELVMGADFPYSSRLLSSPKNSVILT